AAFRLESSDAVSFFGRNDHLGLTIPYDYMGIDHSYEPDFLVRLANGVTLVLEIKGFEDDVSKAKHNAAGRWIAAVNNWGQLGAWDFHVCRNLSYLIRRWPISPRKHPEIRIPSHNNTVLYFQQHNPF